MPPGAAPAPQRLTLRGFFLPAGVVTCHCTRVLKVAMSLSNLAVLVFCALVLFWIVGAYNRLVRLKSLIGKAFAPVDLQLKRRYDLIPNLVDASRAWLPDEQPLLALVMTTRDQARLASDAVRSRPASAAAMQGLTAAEQALHGPLDALWAAVETHPQLQADAAVRTLREDLSSTQSKIGFARQAYNDTALDYNQAQAQFPTVLVARAFSFGPAALWTSK